MARLAATGRMVTLVAVTALVVAACGQDDDVGAGGTEGEATPAATAVVEAAETELGTILVDGDGMTLYVFDTDPDGASACTESCLATWPPLLASEVEAGEGVTATFDTFTREDGDEQVMVGQRPLYLYAPDTEPGDVTGQGVGDVWWVVAADGTKVTDMAGDAASPSPTGTVAPSPTSAPATPATATTEAAPATLALGTTDLGDVVVDADGMTLYVFDDDTAGTSSCTGDCAENWPPATVDGAASGSDDITATVGTTTRDDGTTQVTLDGRPLYRFAGDRAAGDASGHGVGDVWWAVTADGSVAGTAAGGATGYGEPNY